MNAPAQLAFYFLGDLPIEPAQKVVKEKPHYSAPSRRSYRRTETEARERPRTPRFLSWQQQYGYEVGIRHVGPI